MRLCVITIEVCSSDCIVKSGNFNFYLKLLWLYINQKNIVFPLYPLLLFLNGEGFSQYTYWKKYRVSEARLFFSIHSKKP